jgi:hypothetical protein
MNPAPAPPWRRLAPLALGVLGAHLVLLELRTREPLEAQAPASEVHGFITRSIEAPPPPLAVAEVNAPLPLLAVPEFIAPQPRLPPRPAPPAPPRALPPATSELAAGPAVLLVAAPAPPAPPAAPLPRGARLPPPIRLKYEVTATYRGVALQGEGELTWRHDGNEYDLQLEARSPLLGSRRQRSVGRVTAEGLEPLHFWDKSRSEQAAHFDREGGRVTFSNNQPDAPLAAGAQDRLSVVLQLAALVAAQAASYPPGTQVAIPTASVREAETWVFGVESVEDLQLPGGTVRALKLQRLPRREYDQKVELWLAPSMDYAPVRIRLTSPNGDTVDQRWSSTDKG